MRDATRIVISMRVPERSPIRVLGAEYDGSTPVKHLLEILVRDLGLAKVRTRVRKPLRGLRVAAYYGCLLTRPPEVTQFDDAENPRILDDLLTAAGAETVEWPHKTECCGASYSITDADIVKKLSRDILAMVQFSEFSLMSLSIFSRLLQAPSISRVENSLVSSGASKFAQKRSMASRIPIPWTSNS